MEEKKNSSPLGVSDRPPRSLGILVKAFLALLSISERRANATIGPWHGTDHPLRPRPHNPKESPPRELNLSVSTLESRCPHQGKWGLINVEVAVLPSTKVGPPSYPVLKRMEQSGFMKSPFPGLSGDQSFSTEEFDDRCAPQLQSTHYKVRSSSTKATVVQRQERTALWVICFFDETYRAVGNLDTWQDG